MKVILEHETAELVEKKSRFIANVFFATSVDDAEKKLEEMRKKYYDAKHNCYAYVIGKSAECVKSSDDGEPQGTAGHPMLDILRGNDLTNVIAIVTRYFGGTLLGTGGLVRAYSECLKKALSVAKFADISTAYEVSFNVSYDDYGKVENIVQNINQNFASLDGVSCKNIYSIDKSFEDIVGLKYLINEKVFDKFKVDISNITKGKITLENDNKKIYYIKGNDIVYI